MSKKVASLSLENLLKTADDFSPLPNADEIAERAYHIWLERGCPDGTCTENWLRAETELRSTKIH